MSIKSTSTTRLTKRHGHVVAITVALVLISSPSCSSYHRQELKATAMENNGVTSPMLTSDDQLISLVKQIAAGADEKSEAWKNLNTTPSAELSTRLQRIRNGLPDNDRRRISITFVLCLLGQDYENNKSLIVKEMLREPQQENPDADWELELVHRLIARGDTRLLPALFDMVPRADGAMAEAISGYVTYHMRNQPEQFLLALKPQRKELRRAVYWSLVHDELLTENDLASIRRYLGSVPNTTPTFDVAHEMLSALPQRLPNENNR
jgi:hypothetical protein